MVSIVIAAHNEESVLGATLDALLADNPGVEVIVVPNGCTDGTARVARARPNVTVIERAEGGKAAALNAADALATSFPRIYLDADILVPPGGVDAVTTALEAHGTLVAVPDRELDVSGRPWPVRSWTLVHERLPVFADGLFGRGMIALSAEARARFSDFPLMVADDLFLDSLYSSDEKAHVDSVAVVLETPATTNELLDRLVRVRRGSAAMRHAGRQGEVNVAVRPPDRWSWLRDVVAREPRLVPAGFVYVFITLLAAARARRGPLTNMSWGRTNSDRARIGG